MKRSPTELMNMIFSAVMVIITFAGAFVFFFTDLMQDKAYGSKRYILGTIFLAYAIYRSYRMYSALKHKEE